MDLQEVSIAGAKVLEVVGRVDSATAPILQQRLTALMTESGIGVVLDLGKLDYISSAGFRVLLLAAKRADQIGGRFAMCNVRGKVSQLFELGGFLDLFSIAATREDGVSAVARRQSL